MRGPSKYFVSGGAFDGLTERARFVFALAEQYAGERRSPEISPEDVLRGMTCGGRGVGRAALEGLGVELVGLLPDIIGLAPVYPERKLPRTLDEMLKVDVEKLYPEIEMGDGARGCLSGARESAASMGHNYVGTEHVLLGLLRVESAAGRFLRDRGVSFDSAKRAVEGVLFGDET